ncbi:hypothetical protein BDN71DRAFT_430733 [Pleurotus eryngii]|uniref:Uncharacterized protein n=1 Tax=Pleurotus eryngii TaxID=5323 RepID=A0A9P5ZHU5_PLEER|nr:hypothetical protein BDN71DRAFT_430733 [Pleurotus eryngii]
MTGCYAMIRQPVQNLELEKRTNSPYRAHRNMLPRISQAQGWFRYTTQGEESSPAGSVYNVLKLLEKGDEEAVAAGRVSFSERGVHLVAATQRGNSREMLLLVDDGSSSREALKKLWIGVHTYVYPSSLLSYSYLSILSLPDSRTLEDLAVELRFPSVASILATKL